MSPNKTDAVSLELWKFAIALAALIQEGEETQQSHRHFNQEESTTGMKSLSALVMLWFALDASSQPLPSLADRVEGMLLGSLIGDAAGGPHEFQHPERSPWTQEEAQLTDAGLKHLARSFRLVDYEIPAAPYAHWTDAAPAGTVTDDSRFKVIFFESLEHAGAVNRESFARSILSFHADTTGRYGSLPGQWLDEFAASARWILGETEVQGALPPERVWGGIPTMAGQMPFLPIAALHAGDPVATYRSVWRIDFLDNGIARDLNAALVAGLATALQLGASWTSVETAMRDTDPFGFGEVPWVPRKVGYWLDVAHDAALRSGGQPSRLFAILEEELNAVTWWEAWVPMTVVFACAELADYDPLATMQLVLEFGHDTDSYLQVAGAFVGALHGKEIFPEEMRELVEARLKADYGASVTEWMRLLGYDRN